MDHGQQNRADQMCEVVITAPDPVWLDHFSARLVESRLAAARHQFQEISSIFWWNDNLEQRKESRVSLRTRLSLFEKINEAVIAEHPYSTPSCVAIPIIAAHPDYAEWVWAQTQEQNQSVALREDESR